LAIVKAGCEWTNDHIRFSLAWWSFLA